MVSSTRSNRCGRWSARSSSALDHRPSPDSRCRRSRHDAERARRRSRRGATRRAGHREFRASHGHAESEERPGRRSPGSCSIARRRSPTAWCRQALRESYAQMTESTMAGVLAAGATVGPAGGATAITAEQAIRTALGLLPGTRFAPGRVILPSAHVWGALVGADGPDGRPLVPVPAQRADERGRHDVDGRTRPARSPASRLARRGRSPRGRSSSGRARPTRCRSRARCLNSDSPRRAGPSSSNSTCGAISGPSCCRSSA